MARRMDSCRVNRGLMLQWIPSIVDQHTGLNLAGKISNVEKEVLRKECLQ